jgi:predicted O-methyltransferase YrrM
MIDISKACEITGWMSKTELKFLAQTAKESLICIEFGSYMGRSTRAIGDHTPGIVFAVDPWDGKYYKEDNTELTILRSEAEQKFHQNLSDLIMKNKVVPIKGYSHDFVLPSGKADFIFIDGDHRRKAVEKDIDKALSLIAPGGVIAGHDYCHSDWPGVKAAVDFKFGPVESCDSIWWTHA